MSVRSFVEEDILLLKARLQGLSLETLEQYLSDSGTDNSGIGQVVRLLANQARDAKYSQIRRASK